MSDLTIEVELAGPDTTGERAWLVTAMSGGIMLPSSGYAVERNLEGMLTMVRRSAERILDELEGK